MRLFEFPWKDISFQNHFNKFKIAEEMINECFGKRAEIRIFPGREVAAYFVAFLKDNEYYLPPQERAVDAAWENLDR